MPDLAVRYTPTDLDTESLGDIFVKSGYFKDTRDKAQAIVKILAGRELGFGPIASMQGVYLVNGRVTLSANLVGAAIKRSGRYDYRIGVLDHTTCRLKFYEQGQQIGESSFSLDDARKAGLTANETYTKYIRNMLFSRALTNGARWYCPDVFNGPIYTPDELGAQVDLETGEVLEFVPLRDQTPEDDGPLVTSAADPQWLRWLEVQGEGQKYGVVIPRVGLPMKLAQLREVGNGVYRATQARKKKLAQQDAENRSSGDNQPPRLAPGELATPPVPRPRVTVRSALGQQLANLIEEAARLEVPFDDCRIQFPADEEQVIRAIERLQDRIQDKKDQLAGLAEAEADEEPQQALV